MNSFDGLQKVVGLQHQSSIVAIIITIIIIIIIINTLTFKNNHSILSTRVPHIPRHPRSWLPCPKKRSKLDGRMENTTMKRLDSSGQQSFEGRHPIDWLLFRFEHPLHEPLLNGRSSQQRTSVLHTRISLSLEQLQTVPPIKMRSWTMFVWPSSDITKL